MKKLLLSLCFLTISTSYSFDYLNKINFVAISKFGLNLFYGFHYKYGVYSKSKPNPSLLFQSQSQTLIYKDSQPEDAQIATAKDILSLEKSKPCQGQLVADKDGERPLTEKEIQDSKIKIDQLIKTKVKKWQATQSEQLQDEEGYSIMPVNKFNNRTFIPARLQTQIESIEQEKLASSFDAAKVSLTPVPVDHKEVRKKRLAYFERQNFNKNLKNSSRAALSRAALSAIPYYNFNTSTPSEAIKKIDIEINELVIKINEIMLSVD